MLAEWYIKTAEGECGPIARSELLEMLRTGAVAGSAMVRSRSSSEWRRADSVVGADSAPSAPLRDVPALAEGTDKDWSKTVNAALAAVKAHGGVQHTPRGGNRWGEGTFQRLFSGPRAIARFIGGVFGVLLELVGSVFGLFGRRFSVVEWFDRMLSRSWFNRSIRIGYRVACALGAVAVAAYLIEDWSCRQALHWPHRGMTWSQYFADRTFPFYGACETGEYVTLLLNVSLAVAAIGYCLAWWLESRAED